MLKIKDNIDLKELEKYGFEKGFRFQPLNPLLIVAIVDTNRKLIIQYSTSGWYDNNYWYLYDKKQDNVYDLIKDDLVEKID
mgnify:CR=1 FL=1